jgi:hypothetical protein
VEHSIPESGKLVNRIREVFYTRPCCAAANGKGDEGVGRSFEPTGAYGSMLGGITRQRILP